MEKEKIIEEGLKQLNSFASGKMNWSLSEPAFSIKNIAPAESDTMRINHGEIDLNFTVLVQPWAPQKDIDALVAQAKSLSTKTILFADFINPVMAEKFRRRSISFVDCAGNLFIKDKTLNFFVKGKKALSRRSKRVRGRAFNTAGLKLIFAIFNKPELLFATYRDISSEVKIALGSVGPVMDDLHASGYILEDGQRRLVNKKRLFERWVDGYLEKLRPRQIISSYTATDVDWWKTADPAEFEGVWGGEVVIAKSTPFMIPETISLYFSSDKKAREFSSHYGLKEDIDGDIGCYKTFWSTQVSGSRVISPMVMYADIVDSINPGSWDVAKTFYGEAVAHLLAE